MDELKALSLTQPWATLVAIGVKEYETRSWRTHYRGELAIHACAAYPLWAKLTMDRYWNDLPDVRQALARSGITLHAQFPTGAVLAIVRVLDVCRTEDVRGKLSAQELALGDFRDGRYAWKLELVRKLDVPMLADGAQRLWTWRP